jgi:tetratricopeptide (TPR) repeat protein
VQSRTESRAALFTARPTSADEHASQARALCDAFSFEEAHAAALLGLALAPHHAACLRLAVESGLTASCFEKALSLLETQAEDVAGDDSWPRDLRFHCAAHALLHLGRPEEGLAAIDKALSLQRRPEHFGLKGWLYDALKLAPLGRDSYYKVLWDTQAQADAGSKDPMLWQRRSFSCLQLKKYDEAIEDAETGLALSPHECEGYKNKGRALFGLKEYEEAEGWLGLALLCRPRWGEASFWLAHTLVKRGNLDAAREQVRLLSLASRNYDTIAADDAVLKEFR